MSFYTYFLNIPNPPNNPATDVPNMKTNTNSILGLINEDHYGFNNPMGGLHRQVTLPQSNGPPGSIPAGLLSGEGTLYTKAAQSTGMLTETDLFYSPDNTSNEYQLSRTITGSFPLFSTNTNYISPVTTFGGWTFLPGGLLFQYGFIVPIATPGTTTIFYPIPFPNGLPFMIQVTGLTSLSSSIGTAILNGTVNNISFGASTTGSNLKGFYWMAIGK